MTIISRVSLGAAVAMLLFACSSDQRQAVVTNHGGTAGLPGASDAGTTSAGGGSGANLTRGEVLELIPGSGEVPYAIGPNPYGIQGGGFLARAPNGNTLTIGDEVGQLCLSGNLEQVPNGDYSGYWGVEIGFNLNQGGAGGTGGVGGGAAMAGYAGAADAARPWLSGNVIGFSFVIEGPTINPIRFKALPAGFDPTLESSVYCKGMLPASGAVDDVLFTQMTQYCWSAGNNLLPVSNGLDNIAWQLPADVGVGARPFDWCLKDLRPILAD